MLNPDWLVEDEDTKRFFRQCETECEAECCGLDAFGVPLARLEEPYRGAVIADLESIDLCRVRRRVCALIDSLVSRDAPVASRKFNDTWTSGRDAAAWFAGYIVVLEEFLGEAAAKGNTDDE